MKLRFKYVSCEPLAARPFKLSPGWFIVQALDHGRTLVVAHEDGRRFARVARGRVLNVRLVAYTWGPLQRQEPPREIAE